MKISELEKNDAVTKDKTLEASLALCEGIISMLTGRISKATRNFLKTQGGNIDRAIRVARGMLSGIGRNSNWDNIVLELSGLKTGRLHEAEYEGGIDFEAQPDYANVKGVNLDNPRSHIDSVAANKKQAAKLNKAWVRLVGNLSKLNAMDPKSAQTLKMNLRSLAHTAKENNFNLVPSPEQVFGD